jgi:hypothetical protein
MAPSEPLKALVNQMPDPDERGMYCHIVVGELPPDKGGKRKVETRPIDKDKIEKAIAGIHKGGRENILGVIDMLVEPGQGDDIKARYALHCLAVYVCTLKQKEGDDSVRRDFSAVLASQLGANRPKGVRAYLAQELEVAGGPEAVPALAKLLLDQELCDWAARAIVSIGAGAAEQFRAALPQAKGFARLTALQNLGVLRDAAGAPAFRAALVDADREIRLAAAWGLARIGDASSADLLLKAADVGPGWERIQMTKACLVLAENLVAAGKKADAARIYTRLRDSRKDPTEKYVRDLAAGAVAAMK